MGYFVSEDQRGNEVVHAGRIAMTILGAIAALVCLVLLLKSITTISAGDRGVVLDFGAFRGQVFDPGLHFKNPITQRVIHMSVQTQKNQVDATAASKDLQDVQATVAVTNHIDPMHVGDLYQQVGYGDSVITDTIMNPAIQESIKAATSQFTAEELVTKRDEVKEKIRIALKARLSEKFIVVEDVSIVNFKFSDSFEKAIEEKVTAEQNALKAKNNLEQVKFEAQQQIETAKAQAESIKIQASAINAQGGADYVRLQAINKWDGKVPVQMVPNAAVPFIDLTK